MVRVSVFYDEEVKGQVFKVRGDERYARTTKTTLELGTVTLNTSTFDLNVSVNVYRDVGSSNLVIYDNDVIIYNETWTSTDTARTITLNDLAFEVEHNLVAKYIGNNQCSPSSSKVVAKEEIDPRKTEAILTIDNNNVRFDPHGTFTATVTLDNDVKSEWNDNQDIEIVYDGETVTTINTSSTRQFTISDLGNPKRHTLSIIYRGSTHLIAKTITIQLSVGYLLVPTIPNIGVYGSSLDIPIFLEDYLGEPVIGETVTFQAYKNNTWTTLDTEVTNNEGKATLSWDIDVFEDISLRLIGSRFGYEWYHNIIEVESLTMSASPPRLLKNTPTLLSVDTGIEAPNIPIELGGYVSDRIYTDTNGVAQRNVMGTGRASKTITATLTDISSELQLDDYVQYWESSSGGSLEYYTRSKNVDVTTNSSGCTIIPTSSDSMERIDFSDERFDMWNLILDGVSTTDTQVKIGIQYRNSNAEYVTWSNTIPQNLTNATIYMDRHYDSSTGKSDLNIGIKKGTTLITSFTQKNLPIVLCQPMILVGYTGSRKRLTFRTLALEGWYNE